MKVKEFEINVLIQIYIVIPFFLLLPHYNPCGFTYTFIYVCMYASACVMYMYVYMKVNMYACIYFFVYVWIHFTRMGDDRRPNLLFYEVLSGTKRAKHKLLQILLLKNNYKTVEGVGWGIFNRKSICEEKNRKWWV